MWHNINHYFEIIVQEAILKTKKMEPVYYKLEVGGTQLKVGVKPLHMFS